MDPNESHSRHTRRDAEILVALGAFLVVLSIPVLIGTFWAEGAVPRAINVGAALIIGAIGGIMVWRGRRPVKNDG